MNQHQRTALRFCAYIRALGGEPITFRHESYRDYARDLHRQHERLRQSLDPSLVKAAQVSARALIRTVGYRRAAEISPVQRPIPAAVNALASPSDVASAITSPATGAASARERKKLRNDAYLCGRKLRHADYWSAIRHLLLLGDPDLRIYPCSACEGGLHVGHDPASATAKRRRKARRRLRVVENRLNELEVERRALEHERAALRQELGETAGSERLSGRRVIWRRAQLIEWLMSIVRSHWLAQRGADPIKVRIPRD